MATGDVVPALFYENTIHPQAQECNRAVNIFLLPYRYAEYFVSEA